MSLQIGLYLGLKELHVSRCVWRGFILDCDVDMRLCVVKLAKKPVVCAKENKLLRHTRTGYSSCQSLSHPLAI